ncbi:MAG: bacteriohemerythrin [Candidatus Gracilibacteria bacterium]|nr:bacteriohemerythrin [Candidatus Gracilibacteria bacterium]
MAFITWNSTLVVGHPQIDQEHQKLVNSLNELHDAMKAGKGSEVCKKVLKELVTYTVAHFATEEKLMTQKSYPDFPSHKREHEELLKQARELNEKVQSGTMTISITVLDFLKNWLAKHIQGTDKKLGKFLTT